MLHRRLARAFLCASTIVSVAAGAPASAQHVDQIIAFGDSYADPGNQFELIGVPYPSLYYTGRFSGGTNYIDTLAAILGVPVDNFAIGGALTGNFNTITGPNLGFTTEVQSFLAGGGPAAFPRVSGTFDQHDLVTVSIGGNDARLYQTGNAAFRIAPGTLAGAPAAAAQSVANATANLDLLVTAGAPTISFLAGNTAILPEVFGQPDPASAAAIRQAYSTAFNSGIQQTLGGYAADGVIVHYLDLTLIAQRIAEDPTAYGLQSAGPCPVAQATRCVTDSSFTNQHLFYVDGLHLTSAGFAIVARYVATQLDAPLTLRAPSDLALGTARQFGRTLSTRVDLYGPRALSSLAPGVRLFLVGDSFSRDVERTDDNNAFDVDGLGITGGVEIGLPGGVAGVAANYTQARVRFGNDSSRDTAPSYQIGAYAGFGFGRLFAQGHVGYGNDKHRLRRTGVIDDMAARPDGSHVTAGAKAGYLMTFSDFRIGPIAALDYARAKVDGYTETGDPALTLNVSSQKLKSLTGQIGIEARARANAGVASFNPYVSATLEHEFEGDGRTIAFAQTSAPTIVSSWTIDGDKQTYGRVSAGAAAQLFTAISLNAAVSSTLGRDGGNELGAQLGLRVGF